MRKRQTPYPVRRTHPTTQSEQGGLDASQPSMSSAAYYGQRPVGYETGKSRDSYLHQAPSSQRSWATLGDGQSWPQDYKSSSEAQAFPYQPPRSSSHQVQIASQSHLPVSTSAAAHVTRYSTRPSTPNSTHSSHSASGTMVNGDDSRGLDSMVKHSLQIPARISAKGGNLADFAAQVRLNSGSDNEGETRTNSSLAAHLSDMVRASLGIGGCGEDAVRDCKSVNACSEQIRIPG